ncbi:MAG: transglycosylase SLT domain-containing protein [Gammaproteobacteria bacterium]|nr:transglycosylase SLT domain-containing protein [Gammaproteobacteria bacterium]
MRLRALLLILSFATTALAEPAAEADYSAQRHRFGNVYRAIQAGKLVFARKIAAGLEHYPLYQYLRYEEIRARLGTLPTAEVRAFLHDYAGSLLAGRLRTEWLRALARARHWEAYSSDYEPQRDAILRCLVLQARLETGDTVHLLSDARPLWLNGRGQPKECDEAFTYLVERHEIDDELVWKRIALALEAGQPALARSSAARLTAPELKALADTWLVVHQLPDRAFGPDPLGPDTPQVREILIHAVKGLAMRDVEKARAGWAAISTRYAFTPDEQGRAARHLALAAAAIDHPQKLALLDLVPPPVVDGAVEVQQLRAALESQAWRELARWTEKPAMPKVNPLAWRYWRARALEATGDPAGAKRVFQELARQRDYYGFLASDRLEQPYAMGDHAISPTEEELAAVGARPGMQRAREFQRLGLRGEARQEWQHELTRMTNREIEIAAHYAYEWGWYDRAIFATGKIESYDDLGLRFPTVHKDLVYNFAHKRQIRPEVVFSIIRAESAFMTEARSPTGALGLMQLMPATGLETAKKLGLRLKGPHELFEVEKNIAVGSEYLRQVLAGFGGSFQLAAAAYNAGPNRVRSWVAKSGCVPADVWIDTIPFLETREYVRRTMYYATIYEYRLAGRASSMSDRLIAVGADAAPGAPHC